MIGGFIGKPIGGAIRDDGITAVLTKTLDDAAISAAGALALKAAVSITLADAALSSSGTVALKASVSATLDAAALSATGALALKGQLSQTLDDAAISASGAVAIKAAFAVTLDDVVYTITGGPDLTITDTEVLQKPVNCVLAGQQPYKFSGREYEIRPRNQTERGGWNRTRVARLRGQRPSFTTTTNNRGYD